MFKIKTSGRSTYLVIVVICAFSFFAAGGCNRWAKRGPKLDYKTVVESPTRDSAAAEERHLEALNELERGNVQGCEQLVQKALIADVSYGPAHNTLGKLYFDCQKFYLAAWEFEYAAESMPGRGEPRNNLGLVYEAVEKLDEAIIEYQTAHSLDPENPEYLGNLLRARVRKGEEPASMRQEFKDLLFLETRPSWQSWCRRVLAFNARESDQSSDTRKSPPFDSPQFEGLPSPSEDRS